jgi:tetratricopeptide (TPR) repeat protein
MRHGMVWVAAVAMSSALVSGSASADNRASVVPDDAPAKPSLATQSGRALIAGDGTGALAKAEAAVKAEPQSGFAHYCKAEALSELKRHDDAVVAYDAALAKLPAGDARARNQAMWGRALALRATGRCDEARVAFGEYAQQVRASDASAAAQALEHASACRTGAETAKK